MADELSRPPGRGPRPAPENPETETRARRLLTLPEVRKAVAYVRDTDRRTLEDQRELSEIPAPPFGERTRAFRMAELMDEVGLQDVVLDREGNVLGLFPGSTRAEAVILSAHLDTVFPAGTDVRVRLEGDRLIGPGIGDDARGLAALLATARTLLATNLEPGSPLLFVATVGEEGPGDLRGVRHLFREGGPGRSAEAFISLDGAGIRRLVTAGLGVRRYRVSARGAGGHSWVDWGTPNPIHRLGQLVAELDGVELPEDPATTLTVARWGGGTSINAIPQKAWVELELRSEDERVLESLDTRIRALAEGVADPPEVGAYRTRLTVQVDVLGRRPSGETPAHSCLVRAAAAATRAIGAPPELTVSSTDANIPMSLGIPALTMGGGGEAGQAHTPDEWYSNRGGPDGVIRALLTVLLLGGARDG